MKQNKMVVHIGEIIVEKLAHKAVIFFGLKVKLRGVTNFKPCPYICEFYLHSCPKNEQGKKVLLDCNLEK